MDAAQRNAALKSAAGVASRWLMQLLAAAAVLASLGFGGQAAHEWALSSPTFALKTVEFHGLRRATEADLVKAGGLTPGLNLFQLDLAAVARAMAAQPYVRSIDVRRHMPSSVTVVVTEHEPAALVSLGDLYLLDREGEPFKRLQASDAVDLPLVTGIERDAYVSAPEATAERLRAALALIAAYDKSDRPAGPRLSEVRLEADGATLVTSRGVEVRLPEGAKPEELNRLSRVAEELSRRGLTAEVIRLDNRVRPGWVTVTVSRR